MTYRKPVVYFPPYNYCDRACGSCAVDKSRCLLYQTEMDERLHREIDGLDEPTPGEMVDRIVEDAHRALRLVEDQARDMGIDPEILHREASPAPRERRADPIVDEATLAVKALAAFLRQHGEGHVAEVRAVRPLFTHLVPKLGRASMEAGDETEEADAILQAQVAHRAIVGIAAALDAMRRAEPALGDELIDLLAFLKELRVQIEERWLSKPSALLEPVTDAAWWGPLRDITPTLKHFRR